MAVFMSWAAGRYTVFDDEAFSCRRYTMPAGEMVSALWHGVEPDPPLYYILENAWVGIFGLGPLGLRSLSIIIFLIALIVIRQAGSAWFDPRTGLVAMILCALHPAHLFFGFAARWYSLMFLMSALVIWLTARLAASRRSERRLVVGWALAAAGACYTNYFGVAVVALAWLIGLGKSRGTPHALRRWLCAAAGALLLYIPWLVPFWKQVTAFPMAGKGSAFLCAAVLARTTLALLAGNLASIGAWWAWAPLGVFGIAVAILTARQWRIAWPVASLFLGCLAAGVASRTMIDKYIMTFSGAACLLAAALLARNVWASPPSPNRLWARAALVCLVIGWIGCGVNLVTQRHWSSLRWLDPFEQVTADLFAQRDAPPPRHWAMTHPSARYYFGCSSVRRADSQQQSLHQRRWKIDAELWRQYAEPPSIALRNSDLACGTPTAILQEMESTSLHSLVTVETAGFREPAEDWEDLLKVLTRSFAVTWERDYLEDPTAALKDWLDPAVTHPGWRIMVRRWEPIMPQGS